MEMIKINDTPVRTARNFNINDISIEKSIITEMFKKKERNDDDLKVLKDIMVKKKKKKISEKTADEYINKSLNSLNIFEDNDYRKALITLALAMVGRTA